MRPVSEEQRRETRLRTQRAYRDRNKEVNRDERLAASAVRNANATLRKGGIVSPQISSPYRLLARTCTGCGDLLTTPDHLLRKDAGAVPPCRTCRVRQTLAAKHKRLVRDEAFAQLMRDRQKIQRRRKQADTVDGAHNNKKEWTGAELEMASRYDLTAAQIAARLGRTLYSVKHMRKALKDEPRTIMHAGLSESGIR